jgi:hypothetical protein
MGNKKIYKFKKNLGVELSTILVITLMGINIIISGCSEDDIVQSEINPRIVVDNFSATADVQFRGTEKETKFDYIVKYRFFGNCGSIEKVSFTVKNFSRTTNYRQSGPTPIGVVNTKDYWFWIPDTLAGLDSVTLSCTINGTFYKPISCSKITDKFEWTDSIDVFIHRQ